MSEQQIDAYLPEDIIVRQMDKKSLVNIYYRLNYYDSFLIPFLSIYALRYQLRDMILITLMVSFTSINYWRYPCRGWRRDIDRIVVKSSIFYILYMYSMYLDIFLWSLLLIGLVCYGMACLIRDPFHASILHFCMRTSVKIFHLILYPRIES